MVKVYFLLDLDWTWVNSRILNESKKIFWIFGSAQSHGLGLGLNRIYSLNLFTNNKLVFRGTILGILSEDIFS